MDQMKNKDIYAYENLYTTIRKEKQMYHCSTRVSIALRKREIQSSSLVHVHWVFFFFICNVVFFDLFVSNRFNSPVVGLKWPTR